MTDRMTEHDRDDIWQAIETQRRAVADLLDDLSDDEWQRPSLCEGWTVRDVAAHLTLQQLGLGDMLAILPIMARARGNLDRATHDMACHRAATRSPAQLIAEIRGTAGARRHNLGVTYLETLTDLLVHGQDIALPLGRPHDMPVEPAAVAATRMWTMRWPPPFPIRKNLRRYHLIATDAPWSAGDGPEVHGPMSALLLLNCGRLAALPQLSGPGAADLAAQVAVGI